MSATFLASAGRIIWRMAEGHDVDPTALFNQAGLDPNRINQPRARYSVAKVCRAFEHLAELTQCPHLGLEAGHYYRVTDLHAVGVAFLASHDLIEAFSRLDRYEAVLHTKVDYELEKKPGCIHFVCKSIEIESTTQRLSEDLRHSILVDLIGRGLDRQVQPLEICVTYPEPLDASRYQVFFNCPVKFSQPLAYMAFSDADATATFTARNSDLASESDNILDRLLDSATGDDPISRTRHSIMDALPSGTPSVSMIAGKLLTTPRTLHRRLAESGTTFRLILESVRADLAKSYLREENYPITEVSYLLGFADPSSFSRAFKRWTGYSPLAFRDHESPGE